MEKIVAFIFTYTPDEVMAAVAARQLSGLGVDHVVIVEQHDAPIDRKLFEGVRGVEVVTTKFDRQKNLNGKECIEGMLTLMQTKAKEHGSGIVIKTDSDTLLGPRFVETVLSGKYQSVQSTYNPTWAAGAGYSFRAEWIPAMLKAIKADKSKGTFPEDASISKLIDAEASTIYREPLEPFDHGYGDFRVVRKRFCVSFGIYTDLPVSPDKAKAFIAKKMRSALPLK